MKATFTPQAWSNDQAIDVDAEGDDEWDCTAAFEALPPAYAQELKDQISRLDEALDRDDYLKNDPAAPGWVREWRGPFSIYVRN